MDQTEMLNQVSQMGFNITISSVISGLLFGLIGSWLFVRARREANLKVLVVSIALMMYPLFTSGPWGDWGVGTALCGLAYYFWFY